MDNGDSNENRRDSRRNLSLLCILSILDGMDMQLLPASFRALEASLGLGPYSLAVLVVCQDLAFSFSGPFWGSLADNGFSKKTLLTLGASGWGVLTLALAFVSSFEMMVILRCGNGAFLGMIVPITQSMVAEESSTKDRGYNFGWIELCNLGIGMTIGTLGVTSVSNRIIFGTEGWRVAFMAVAILSLILAAVVALLMKEKPRPWTPERVGILSELSNFISYCKIPSFNVVCLQGMIGTIPGAALSFATMYFQYLGLLDLHAAIVMCMFHIGGGLGSLLGGVIGDTLHYYDNKHGRPLTAQLSVALGIPIAYVAFTWVPSSHKSLDLAALLFMLGMFSSWCPAGCNKPVFLDIIPKSSQASAMAWEFCIERACGHFVGPLAIGFISEHLFSYKVTEEQVRYMEPDMRIQNAESLGASIAISTVLPWALCFFIYGLLHVTYERDKEALEKLPMDDNIRSSSDSVDASEWTKLLS